jgi:Fe-S-cluster containining protein
MKRHTLPVLPPMRCDNGCGDCCGPVPVTDAEFERVERYAKSHGIEPKAHEHEGTCPMFQDGRCVVYEARPMICVAFGHLPELECSRGYNRNVKRRDVDRALASGGERTRLLHEMIPGFTAAAMAHAAGKLVQP